MPAVLYICARTGMKVLIEDQEMSDITNKIVEEIGKVIKGKDDVIRMTLCAMLAGGHVLLEDIPGVGKTTLALALSKALSLDHKRVQFTPDVMPSDLLGFNMYDKASGTFRFNEGSIYTNLFLADEINRTSPKTQSALLEVMEEGAATVEGETRVMPKPFFVIATQNPFGSAGTQKLPESQLDRFLISLTMGYPDRKSAIDVLKGGSREAIDTVEPVSDGTGIMKMQDEVEALHVDDSIYDYIVRLCEQTRNGRYFELGLSPRGSIAIMKAAKACAYIEGRDYLIPEDIHEIFPYVASHRLRLNANAKAAGTTRDKAFEAILDEVSIPKVN